MRFTHFAFFHVQKELQRQAEMAKWLAEEESKQRHRMHIQEVEGSSDEDDVPHPGWDSALFFQLVTQLRTDRPPGTQIFGGCVHNLQICS